MLVILESPYAGEVEENLAYARDCMRRLLFAGMAPIASHLLYTQEGVLDDKRPDERRLGITAGARWRAVADLTVFCAGRGWSPGMLEALAAVNLRRRPYIVIDGSEPPACTHEGIGLPMCPTCDPRTVDEGGPRKGKGA